MTHLYIQSRWSSVHGEETFKALCTKEYAKPEQYEKKGFSSRVQTSFTTVKHKVTCPLCLDILIPEFEERLAAMKVARGQKETVLAQNGTAAVPLWTHEGGIYPSSANTIGFTTDGKIDPLA